MSNRNTFVDIVKSYIGVKQGSDKHKQIIDRYNSIKPLPRDMELSYSSPWCAAFVSSCACECGVLDVVPAECSCSRQIALWKNLGRYSTTTTPQPGDIIYYDWKNTNYPVDHVGVITAVTGNTVTVVEGNMDKAVGTRTISMSDSRIVGYGLPDFSKTITPSNPTVSPTSVTPNTTTWSWPVPGHYTISSEYGYREVPVAGATSDHKGVDIPAPEGTDIVATRRGTVISAGPASGYGNWIRIDHGDGYVSIYGHMKTLYVKVGDVVAAGQKIAEVGNEGNSTGPHLHFQIEKNGVPVNPDKYLAPNGAVVSSDYDPTDTYYEDDTSAPYSKYAAGITAAQRVSGLLKEPSFPYVNIYIGSDLKLLATDPPKPNIIQSFKIDRMEGAGERVTFSVFDDHWDEIEEIFAKNFNNIYVEYGYYGTEIKSKLLRLRLSDYSVICHNTGTILTVNALTEGAYDNLKTMTFDTGTLNPTEAVRKICLELGYEIGEFDSSEDVEGEEDETFALIGDHPITYIQEEIIPRASNEGEELFTFELTPDKVAHFRRKGYDHSSVSGMRTYIYQKGYDSPVLDITFNLKGVFGGADDFEIATQYKSCFIGEDKKPRLVTVTKSSVQTDTTGDVLHTAYDQSDAILDVSGHNEGQARSILYYRMKSMRFDGYTADMTIVGDPTIDKYKEQFIRIINVTDAGTLHHTSGVYYILDVVDDITGGKMTTTMHLVKNATYNIDGIELINPKAHFKK